MTKLSSLNLPPGITRHMRMPRATRSAVHGERPVSAMVTARVNWYALREMYY